MIPIVALMRIACGVIIFLLPRPGFAPSAYVESSQYTWGIPKCNHTVLAKIQSRQESGYGAGWMPEIACNRDDLTRDEPCSLLAPAPRSIPGPLLAGARLYTERRSALQAEVKENGTLAEVGILTGSFTRWMISVLRPKNIYGLDLQHSIAMRECFGRTSARAVSPGPWAGHSKVHCMGGDSSTNLRSLPDDTFDMIYIDADHEYKGVCRDLEAARRKVKVGGLLVFNDYIKFE